jgi:hypothetical protein
MFISTSVHYSVLLFWHSTKNECEEKKERKKINDQRRQTTNFFSFNICLVACLICMKGLWTRFSVSFVSLFIVCITILHSLYDNCKKVSLSYTCVYHCIDCWWCMTWFYTYTYNFTSIMHLENETRQGFFFRSFSTFQGFWSVNEIWAVDKDNMFQSNKKKYIFVYNLTFFITYQWEFIIRLNPDIIVENFIPDVHMCQITCLEDSYVSFFLLLFSYRNLPE